PSSRPPSLYQPIPLPLARSIAPFASVRPSGLLSPLVAMCSVVRVGTMLNRLVFRVSEGCPWVWVVLPVQQQRTCGRGVVDLHASLRDSEATVMLLLLHKVMGNPQPLEREDHKPPVRRGWVLYLMEWVLMARYSLDGQGVLSAGR